MYKINQEDLTSIELAMKQTKDAKIYAKLQVVLLRGKGYTNDEIEHITGYNTNYVGELCKKFILNGIESFVVDGRKGGNNSHMNDIEAKEFLNQFLEKALKGEVVTLDEIAKAYDEATGVEHKSLSSLYYFLHRHEWRKIMPKKQHPGKASDEVIDASKKLTLSWRK